VCRVEEKNKLIKAPIIFIWALIITRGIVLTQKLLNQIIKVSNRRKKIGMVIIGVRIFIIKIKNKKRYIRASKINITSIITLKIITKLNIKQKKI